MPERDASTLTQASTNPPGNAHPDQWSLITRVAFRFCFCYFFPLGISCFFIQADILHYFTGLAFWKMDGFDPWKLALPWICSHIFHVQKKLYFYPDSDYLAGYLQHLCELLLALIITAVWSILDRNRPNYRRLYAWFTLYLRSMLAITLFGYGFDKVFPLQFGTMTPDRLAKPMGEMDMFNVLWTFMAASVPYTVFSGTLEVIAGVLLLLPRLEMLGAFLSVAVMSNVFLLNMDYGVPVKLFSSHLLLVSILLAAPGLVRLANLLVLRRTTAPIQPQCLSNNRWIHRGGRFGLAAFATIMGIVTFFSFRGHFKQLKAEAVKAQSMPYYGMWKVDTFIVPITNSSAPPSLFTPKLEKEYRVSPGTDHWEGLNFSAPNRMTILLRDGVTDGVDLSKQPDPTTGQTQVTDSDDPTWKASLIFVPSGQDVLSIQGVVNGISIQAKYHKREVSKFPLTQEKFRWIQDDPAN